MLQHDLLQSLCRGQQALQIATSISTMHCKLVTIVQRRIKTLRANPPFCGEVLRRNGGTYSYSTIVSRDQLDSLHTKIRHTIPQQADQPAVYLHFLQHRCGVCPVLEKFDCKTAVGAIGSEMHVLKFDVK